MRRIYLVLVLILLASLPGFGQVNGHKRRPNDFATHAVLAAQTAFVAAARQGDRQSLDRLVSEDFIQTAASGKYADKAAMIADTVANPGFDHFDVKVRLYGGVAVVTGAYGFAANDLRQRFTAVYRLSRGHWRMVAHQQTIISK